MSIGHLHDDLLLYLARYLNPRDCLSFALSGKNDRFSRLYATNRTRLVLAEWYILSNKIWKGYFKQYIIPSSITVCDVSHCYWLKARVLLRCIIKMPNLEELYIEDTRMSLKKVPQVFEACQKIVKLSITLTEDNLDEFKMGVMEKSSLKWMKKGFKQITHLKLFTFVIPSGIKTNSKAWIAAIGVLKWCRDCHDLLMSISYKEPTNGIRTKTEEDADYFANLESNEALLEEMRPHLDWMKGLKSLVILFSHSQSHVVDNFTRDFLLDWLPNRESLERLWVSPYVDHTWAVERNGLVGFLDGPTVKSAMIDPGRSWAYRGTNSMLNHGRFRLLEHLAQIRFDYLEHGLDHLKELKYICGASGYTKGLNEFCRRHRELEQLHIRLGSPILEEEQHFCKLENWELPLLKILVYHCGRPSQNAIEHLVRACPNIVQFHVGFSKSLNRIETIQFLSTIKFQHLTWLTIAARDNVFDGSYLLEILQSSPKLERLHVEGDIVESTFFLHLAKCFPSARNLRDLRVQWPSLQEDLSHLPFFLRTLRLCTNFERLVLCADADDWSRKPSYYAPLQDSILLFVKSMPHLVALCLAGLPFDASVVEQQLIAQMVLEKENRPAFWFHLGPELPKASDLSVPRVHFDGIVNPMDPYEAPPHF